MISTQDFWTDGFYLPVRALSADQAHDQRAALEADLARWENNPDLLRTMTDYRRSNFHVVSRWGAQIASHPLILDCVEQIIGPDVLLWMTEVIIKEPQTPTIISMHQDLTYWGMDDQDKQVTAWLALTDATPDNGCMSFVRGSHKQGQVTHNDTYAQDNALSRGQEIEVSYEEKDLVMCALNAGEVSFHHGHMFHGSGPNKTDDRRIGIVMRYISPQMKPAVAMRDYAMLVRGANRQGHYTCVAAPASDFSAKAMRLWDEIDAAQNQALAEGAQQDLKYI